MLAHSPLELVFIPSDPSLPCNPVADLGRSTPGTRPPAIQFFSISCSFHKIWQNHMLPPPRRPGAPPTGNPGSTPVTHSEMVVVFLSHHVSTIISDSKSCLSSLNWPHSGKNSHFLALFWLVEGTLAIGWK